jgi:uncharacterized protein (DUF433 family)
MWQPSEPAVRRDPDIHGGEAVFSGTRIAAAVLLDYLAVGATVDDFVSHYPTISRAQALAAWSEIVAMAEKATENSSGTTETDRRDGPG